MIRNRFSFFVVFLILAALAVPTTFRAQQASTPNQPAYEMALYNGHGFHLVYPAPFEQTEMPDGEGIKLTLEDGTGFIVETADPVSLADNAARMRQLLKTQGWKLAEDPDVRNPIQGTIAVQGGERYVRVTWLTGAGRLWYILGYGARPDAPFVEVLSNTLLQGMLIDLPVATAQQNAAATPPPPVQQRAPLFPAPAPQHTPVAPPSPDGCPGCAQAMSTYMNNMTKITNNW